MRPCAKHRITFCGIMDTKLYVQQTLMRFNRCNFEFSGYEFRVVTADILNSYCLWISNFTNLSVMYTASIFPILIILIYGLLITSFLLFVKKIGLRDYHAVCVCVCVRARTRARMCVCVC